MNRLPTPNLNERPRLPGETLGRGVWLYVRVCLSNRDGAELMAERRVTLTNEVVRYWCRTCGQADAHQLRRRPPPVQTFPRRRSGRCSLTFAPSTRGPQQDHLRDPGHARCQESADAYQAESC
jgi:hypothetical protein